MTHLTKARFKPIFLHIECYNYIYRPWAET